MTQHKMQTIRPAAEEIKPPLSHIERPPQAVKEQSAFSRRAKIRQAGEQIGTLFPFLDCATCLKIEWIENVLQFNPLLLLDALNALGRYQGFRVVREGEFLKLEDVANG